MSKAKIVAAAILSLGTLGIAQANPVHFSHDGWANNHRQDGRDHDSSAPVAAPEIDPASASTALTLLMGGLAVVRGRRRTKN